MHGVVSSQMFLEFLHGSSCLQKAHMDGAHARNSVLGRPVHSRLDNQDLKSTFTDFFFTNKNILWLSEDGGNTEWQPDI